MAEIYLINIKDGITDRKYQDFLQKVTHERRSKIERYKFKSDAKRSLYAALLLQYIIFKKHGLNPDEFKIKHNSYGKPYIHEQDNWQFNISHSGEWVICAWDQEEIGIDIQGIGNIELEIARRFFGPNEYKYLQSVDEKNQLCTFFRLWTLKESYIKYKGKGLSISLDSFEFDMRGPIVFLNPKPLLRLSFHEYVIQGGYKIALCCRECQKPSLKVIHAKEIWKTLCC